MEAFQLKICKLTRLNYQIQLRLNSGVVGQTLEDLLAQFEETLDALNEPEAQEVKPQYEAVLMLAYEKEVALVKEKMANALVVPATSAVSTVGGDALVEKKEDDDKSQWQTSKAEKCVSKDIEPQGEYEKCQPRDALVEKKEDDEKSHWETSKAEKCVYQVIEPQADDKGLPRDTSPSLKDNIETFAANWLHEGLVESWNQSAKQLQRAGPGEEGEWGVNLPRVVAAYHMTEHAGMEGSPFEVLLGPPPWLVPDAKIGTTGKAVTTSEENQVGADIQGTVRRKDRDGLNLTMGVWWWSERVRERDVMMWLTNDVWPVRCT